MMFGARCAIYIFKSKWAIAFSKRPTNICWPHLFFLFKNSRFSLFFTIDLRLKTQDILFNRLKHVSCSSIWPIKYIDVTHLTRFIFRLSFFSSPFLCFIPWWPRGEIEKRNDETKEEQQRTHNSWLYCFCWRLFIRKNDSFMCGLNTRWTWWSTHCKNRKFREQQPSEIGTVRMNLAFYSKYYANHIFRVHKYIFVGIRITTMATVTNVKINCMLCDLNWLFRYAIWISFVQSTSKKSIIIGSKWFMWLQSTTWYIIIIIFNILFQCCIEWQKTLRKKIERWTAHNLSTLYKFCGLPVCRIHQILSRRKL